MSFFIFFLVDNKLKSDTIWIDDLGPEKKQVNFSGPCENICTFCGITRNSNLSKPYLTLPYLTKFNIHCPNTAIGSLTLVLHKATLS